MSGTGSALRETAGSPEAPRPLISLRVLSVVAPAAFVAVVIGLTAFLADEVPPLLLVSAGVLMVIAAATLFSSFVFNVVERSEAELHERGQQLAAVQAAATSLSSSMELRTLLRRFVELARSITGARYGALAILQADGSIDEFITSGMTEAEVNRMAHPPVGQGLLGVIIREGTSVRIREITADHRSVGFPAHHPRMKSLLGVPVISKGRIFGNLYLTDKEFAFEFSETDEEMVRLLAAHAAVAVDNARLYERSREVAVLEERQRISMDLHDGVIQSLYGVGLTLEDALDDPAEDEARERVEAAIGRLDTVMKDIRRYIYNLSEYNLGEEPLAGVRFTDALLSLAREFEASALVATDVHVDASLASDLAGRSDDLLQIVREALANVAKHAGASRATVSLRIEDGVLRLRIEDDGHGLRAGAAEAEPPDHHGLANMRDRARSLGGSFSIGRSSALGGTAVDVVIPATEVQSG